MTKPRVALILGGGNTVFADVQKARALGRFDGLVVINDVGVSFPQVADAWVSLHGNKLPLWAARRKSKRLPPHRALYGDAEAPDVDPVRAVDPALVTGLLERRFDEAQEGCGSSGLFALKVALVDLGFDRAVLCGVPMERRAGHFFSAKPWHSAMRFRKAWIEVLPHIRDRTRSMSGWTRELLGGPTRDFIGGDNGDRPVSGRLHLHA